MDPVNAVIDTVAPRRVEPKVVIVAAVTTAVVVAGVVTYRKFLRKPEHNIDVVVAEPAE